MIRITHESGRPIGSGYGCVPGKRRSSKIRFFTLLEGLVSKAVLSGPPFPFCHAVSAACVIWNVVSSILRVLSPAPPRPGVLFGALQALHESRLRSQRVWWCRVPLARVMSAAGPQDSDLLGGHALAPVGGLVKSHNLPRLAASHHRQRHAFAISVPSLRHELANAAIAASRLAL
jgi:hypothetical protein